MTLNTLFLHHLVGSLLFCGALAFRDPASLSNIEPAYTTVPTQSGAGAPLQPAETLQLTDDVVGRIATQQITREHAVYFAFPNSAIGNKRLALQAAKSLCKAFPGDARWPDEDIWETFNALLDGALIPTIPIAAPCYDTKWGPKDAAKCDSAVSRSGDANFQYVFLHPALIPAAKG